ncbi:MAG: glycosyltransferase family 4 protein [Ignavibacteriales bacterium]|nr:glycosyltransferase family 4 protein [Ignavibacteriales bacterium]
MPRHVCDLANGLRDCGMTPVVAATDGPFRARLSEGIRFVDIELLRPGSFAKKSLGLWSAYRKLSDILAAEHFDIIHSHKRYSDLLARLLVKRFRISHTSTCHNIFRHSVLTSHFPQTIIAPSTAVAKSLRTHYGDGRSVEMIHLGIRPLQTITKQGIDGLRSKLSIAPATTVLASVGQLIPSKDRGSLLAAAGIVRTRMPDNAFTLLIIGDGPEKTKLLLQTEALGLNGNVRFLSGQTDVTEIFNICSFGVLSSLREGLPYVLLEAASVGKPHVATDVGGVTDFATHRETGFLVPPKNPEALAGAIIDMLLSPDRVAQMGLRAKLRFENDFGFDRFINETVNHYTTLLHSVL